MRTDIILSILTSLLGLISLVFCKKIVNLIGPYKGNKREFTIEERISHLQIFGLLYTIMGIFFLLSTLFKK